MDSVGLLRHRALIVLACYVTGQGSYGTVYKGRVKATGEIVAIKTIPVAPHGEQTVIQKEIDMLKECQHPNIVRYMVCCYLVTLGTLLRPR